MNEDKRNALKDYEPFIHFAIIIIFFVSIPFMVIWGSPWMYIFSLMLAIIATACLVSLYCKARDELPYPELKKEMDDA